MQDNYEDIIHLPHHVSENHAQMPLSQRAAQFSPFAALTGYDACIAEADRRTDAKRELSDEEQRVLNETLRLLDEHTAERPGLCVTYFLPDSRKSGGSYRSISGRLRRIDSAFSLLILSDYTKIPIEDIVSISTPLADKTEDIT